ncbi:hypothetical protein M422DRAFT_256688 [Sphaerobolus stellatus SS14]|uniref:CxC2-like cysteine cluster KDZ transposase-associated domain-containing protein n=1 Tax=Sphaerobolus stellatus (strain SS14) TaxID=990650 RepID=A0A0C9V030_SPHS4|nr:hypothetical protein M422DRAFT_256688 [Sphaerobolus stellatus SS14]
MAAKRKRECPQLSSFSTNDPMKTKLTHHYDGPSSEGTTCNFSIPPTFLPAALSSKKLKVEYETEHVSSTSPKGQEAQSGHSNGQQHHTYSQLLADLQAYKDIVLEEMMNLEWDERIGSNCQCGNAAEFCCEECSNPPFLYQECIVSTHRHAPLHWISRWNGQYFIRTSLSSLQFHLCLGHHGDRCPMTPFSVCLGHHEDHCPMTPFSDAKHVIITHLNGIQPVLVIYCSCPGSFDVVQQRIRAKLFPAMTQKPASAFMFALLKQFQKHSSESGQPAYAYFMALQCITNDVSKDDVLDRYLLCPACPQPQINMASNWERGSREEQHKHTLFLEVDGNFSLDEKQKKKDPDDVSLDMGRGAFVLKAPFDEFLKSAAADLTAEALTCSGFKAADILSQKNKNSVSTGMVDLQKGERYCNVDYALAKALQDVTSECTSMRVVLSYDVGCQCQGTTLKFQFYSRPDSASTHVNKHLEFENHWYRHPDSTSTLVDRIPESETPTVVCPILTLRGIGIETQADSESQLIKFVLWFRSPIVGPCCGQRVGS